MRSLIQWGVAVGIYAAIIGTAICTWKFWEIVWPILGHVIVAVGVVISVACLKSILFDDPS